MAANWAPGLKDWQYAAEALAAVAHPQPLVSISFVRDKADAGSSWELWVEVERTDGNRHTFQGLMQASSESCERAVNDMCRRVGLYVK